MKLKAVIIALFLLGATACFAEETFRSLQLINSTNWGKLFNEMLGDTTPSRGEICFSPVDACLVYRVLPDDLPLTVQSYRPEKNLTPFSLDAIPFLANITLAPADIEKHQKILAGGSAEAVVYPKLRRLVIFANGSPYAQIAITPGWSEPFLLPGDQYLSQPTAAGRFRVSGRTEYFLSGSFYESSVVPFGAWLRPVNGVWCYQNGALWFRVPERIAADLERPAPERQFAYFDIQNDEGGRLSAARWGSGEFGRYAIFCPGAAYSPGRLVYEQAMLTKDLVELLAAPGNDDFDSAVSRNRDVAAYRAISLALARGENNWSSEEAAAVNLFNENRLPREKEARRRTLGSYFAAREKQLALERRARWYERLRRDWPFFRQLREQLRADFDRMGVYSLENRQNIVEEWLTRRLEFQTAVPPGGAKYVQALAFSTFFRPDEKPSTFDRRERAIMQEFIRRVVSGEVKGVALRSVQALNNYNFGLILNDILGDLYKSHGCIHVSPRNSYFLYEILPVGTAIIIHPYADRISEEVLAAIQPLANIVNYAEDLAALKARFADKNKVRIDVFPSSGFWVISLEGQPFAKLAVKGGAQKVMQMVLSRDAKGRPVFEDVLAYPTSPGRFRVLKRVTDYISNIYRETTVIPMGGEIVSRGGRWVFQDSGSRWRDLPAAVADDLNKPSEARAYSFYDPVTNASGEVVSVKWGSHPFGKYALINTKDGVSLWPELIHSSGDLIMEERQLINDLIYVLSAPHDALDDCLDNSPNFGLYKDCFDFVSGLNSGEALGDRERAAYKLHYDRPRTLSEEATLYADTVAAYRSNRGGPKMKLDQRKIDGLIYENYMYVVTIEKYAHHYATLKKYWPELAGLRAAMLRDFNDFVIKDPAAFHSFMRELMLARTRLERLSQESAIQQLARLLE